MLRLSIVLIGFSGALGANLAQAQGGEINPYTGQPVSLESLSRELETAKAQTAVLEERVKQAQLSMTLNVVPVKQRAELELLEQQAKQAAQVNNPPPVQEPQERPQKKVQKPAPPPEPVVRVASIIQAGDALTALLDVNGQTMAVKNGEQTQFGTVAILNEREVRLGVRRLFVNDSTLSRFAISDLPASTGGAMPLQKASQPMVLPPPLPEPSSLQ